MKVPKKFPYPLPKACCAEDHSQRWAEARGRMAAISSLDIMWQTFIHSAERYLLDAIGLKHEYHEFAGRERRPRLAVVRVLKPTAPRLPRVTATTS
eukprot:58809-Pyramimonas_sp.AAC.1